MVADTVKGASFFSLARGIAVYVSRDMNLELIKAENEEDQALSGRVNLAYNQKDEDVFDLLYILSKLKPNL